MSAIKDILVAALIIAEIVIGIRFYLDDRAAMDAAREVMRILMAVTRE